MSADSPEPAGPLLCLGQPVVELICERQIRSLSEADEFIPHFGGAEANIALLAARAGARVALAGACGGDRWGAWLRDQLAGGGVELSWFELLEEERTPLATVTVGLGGEASYTIYGEADGWVARVVGPVVDELARSCGALLIGSGSLVGEEDREVTMSLRERFLKSERPVVFTPNLQLHRWRSRTDAAARANACVPGALLVRASGADAALMTREDDVERASLALLKAGARNVVIGLDEEGAILRGSFRADVEAAPVRGRPLSLVGAEDALTATIAAQLALAGWYEPAIAAGLKAGMVEAARACEHWGATD